MRKIILSALLLALCLPLGVSAEAPVYTNKGYGLSFTLPEGWTEIPSENETVFAAPDDTGALLVIWLNGDSVGDTYAERFDAASAERWTREGRLFEDIVFTELTPIMFAKATDAGGRLYAFYSCRFAGEGFPEGFALFHMQLFFTAEGGALGSVSLIAPATEESNPILEWFDGMVTENVPADILKELNAQVSAQS